MQRTDRAIKKMSQRGGERQGLGERLPRTGDQGRPLGGSDIRELRPEGGGEATQVQIWGKRVSGSGDSMCKGPGVGLDLMCWRNNEEAHMSGAE